AARPDDANRPFFLHDGADVPAVRLFGGGPDVVAADASAPSAGPAAPTAGAPAPPAARSEEPQVTAAGLVRRQPRAATERPVPGGEEERGAGASRRSPDEVRSLLSSYRAGSARGRSEDSVPAGSVDERERP
ncbi:MAG TPA: hypothetical protein VGM93_13815, partial [Acidimicrobiales bacterium]